MVDGVGGNNKRGLKWGARGWRSLWNLDQNNSQFQW